MDGQLSELREMLAEMEIAFLTTIGSDGHLRSRPMQLQRHDPDGTLWFATSLDSHKIDDVRHDGRCCVAFLKDSAYVSISGRAELMKDRSLIEKMWKPTWRGWFPEGPGEPELVLLKVKSLFTQIKNAITHSHEEPAPKKELDLGRSR